MKHTQIVGIPIEKDGEVVGYENAQEIASAEYHKARKRGFVVIPDEYIAKMREDAANETPDDAEPEVNLGKLKKSDLVAIAVEHGLEEGDVKKLTKAKIIEAIQDVQADADAE